jgi:hypothetical protein
LSANTTWALRCWKEIRFGTGTAEIQTEERDGSLLGTSILWRRRGVPGDHAEVIWEDGGLSGLVREKVIGDWATVNELKGAVRILEVKLREPVRGLVLCDASGGTLGLAKGSRGNIYSKVGTTDDPMNVAGDLARAHDGVNAFSDEDVFCCVTETESVGW